MTNLSNSPLLNESTVPDDILPEYEKLPRTDRHKSGHNISESRHKLGGDDDTSEDRILIPLDTLLDVRLGAIAQKDQELAARVLSKGWRDRIKDEIPNLITATELAELYAKRDMETLKHSVLTNMNYFLKRIVKDNLIHTVHTRSNEQVVFEINVWPYKDIDDAFVEMLIECVRFHTFSTSSVVVVNIPPLEMTPEYLRERYKIVVFYTDWIDWISLHKKFFEKKGIPELVAVIPALLDKDADLKEMKKMGLKPSMLFTEFEKKLKPIFDARLHPISLYCVTDSLTQESAADAVKIVSLTEEDIERHILESDPTAEIVHVPVNKEHELDLQQDPDEKPAEKEDDPFSY